jgi:beta-glucanase (GH16 family)
MILRLVRSASLFSLVVVLAACSSGAGGRQARAGAEAESGQDPARSRVHLDISPPIVQQGAGVAPADQADVMLRARVVRAEPGTPVTIQRRVGARGWRGVTTLRADARGGVSWAAPAYDAHGRVYVYRAEARAGRGERADVSPARTARRWQLRFGDEFDGSALDLETWAYRQEGVYAPASDRACSASSPDAVDVEGGHLALNAVEDQQRNAIGPCDQEDGNTRRNQSWYRNAPISARDFRFRYGYAAARVKFDSRQGAHGSFWLQSTKPNVPRQGPNEDGAEIDVVEYFGDAFAKWQKPRSVYSFIYYGTKSNQQFKIPADDDPEQAVTRADAGLGPGDGWSNDYHVFSVRWTPDRYVFYVDGVPTQRVDRGVSQVPEVPILSMLTSGWEVGRFPSGAVLRTDVDWVRVWQQPGGTCTGAPAC